MCWAASIVFAGGPLSGNRGCACAVAASSSHHSRTNNEGGLPKQKTKTVKEVLARCASACQRAKATPRIKVYSEDARSEQRFGPTIVTLTSHQQQLISVSQQIKRDPDWDFSGVVFRGVWCSVGFAVRKNESYSELSFSRLEDS